MNLFVYDLVKASATIFFRLTTSWRVYGRQNLPKSGSLVLVANHFSLADPLIIGSSVSRRLSFIAKQELFSNKILAFIMRKLGSIPVSRGKVVRDTLRSAEKILGQGKIIALFPEGGRSSNGQVGDGFSGAALIAARSGAPLIPVGISGTEELSGAGWMFRRPKIIVSIGEPFKIAHSGGFLTQSQLRESTGDIMASIAALVEPSCRGKYAGLHEAPLPSCDSRLKEPAGRV